MSLLSVIIPAYNEERTLGSLLKIIQAVPIGSTRFQMEIIVVDDGSKDGTGRDRFFATASACAAIQQSESRQRRGRSTRREGSEGEYLLVQDADLEYDPEDYVSMLKALPETGWGVVYGCRRGHPEQDRGPRLANWIISLFTFILYGKWISDPLTAYKLYPTHIVREMKIQSTGFEADHEMTAKLHPPWHSDPRSPHPLHTPLGRRRQKNKSDRWSDRSLDPAQVPLRLSLKSGQLQSSAGSGPAAGRFSPRLSPDPSCVARK